jgi:O-antigen chain-terminating methyltransferase
MPDESVAVITGFHIIEHLPFEILVKLLNEAFRVLRQRGLVIFETPNPANVLVGSCNFYFDPTHRNPLPSLMTQFLVQYCGFAEVEILNLNPSTETAISEDSEIAKRFNECFYGPMDYAIIGYKL